MTISTAGQHAAIHARDLQFGYADTLVLRDVDIDLPQGRRLALLGASGCGKTTLLRLLAGLLTPSNGSIAIAGRQVADAAGGLFVPPERRGLGMVFQDYALWPHMSVAANVAFPLEMARLKRSEIGPRVATALKRVGLDAYADRSPGALSGGQQQRVAIARAIVAEPRLVLFDEPLSNLDRDLRETLAGDLAELLSSLSLSAVYVTHDQSEAFTIADEVAVMQGGEIVQRAAPQILVDAPASPMVAEFLKLGTVVEAARDDKGWRVAGTAIRLPSPPPADTCSDAAQARVLLARKALTVGAADAASALPGKVIRSRFHGDGHALSVALGDDAAPVLEASSEQPCLPGEMVGLAVDSRKLRWFPA